MIDVGNHKQTFIDHRFIEQSRGVTLTPNPPTKAGPLSLSVPPTGYVSVIEHQNRCFVYYGSEGGVSVATSEDGINWVNPEAGPVDRPELGRNGENCSLAFPACTEGGVFIDPKPADDHPFKAIFGITDVNLWGKHDLVAAVEDLVVGAG